MVDELEHKVQELRGEVLGLRQLCEQLLRKEQEREASASSGQEALARLMWVLPPSLVNDEDVDALLDDEALRVLQTPLPDE